MYPARHGEVSLIPSPPSEEVSGGIALDGIDRD
jgi:hypothetical protein